MCAYDNRPRSWIRSLTRSAEEKDWPRLVWWDFIGACALAALLAGLFVLAR